MEFQNLKALIIDIRFNEGGLDFLGLRLASRLTDQRRLGHSKQARFGGYDEYTELHHRYFEPAGVQFLNKPVMLLTSGNTFSAAEAQTLTLKGLPNVTLIGEVTGGGLSDILIRYLPNGWIFSLSNERYFSREGIDYEQKGIPPDIEVIANEDSLNADVDNILSRALREIETLTRVSSTAHEVPATFALAQNYPNPFSANGYGTFGNPETEIRFALPQASRVSVKILNLLGEEVRKLMDEPREAGYHAVRWDGKDKNGNAVASGVYLYQLQAGSFSQVKKMSLLR
jgi:hypothetical protein